MKIASFFTCPLLASAAEECGTVVNPLSPLNAPDPFVTQGMGTWTIEDLITAAKIV